MLLFSVEDALIDICDNPLCIGRKCTSQGDPEYFYGLIDEVGRGYPMGYDLFMYYWLIDLMQFLCIDK